MRIAITWGGVSGYLAACVRALAERDGVEVRLVVREPGRAAPFDPAALFVGLDVRQLSLKELDTDDAASDALSDFAPDVLIVCGWLYRAYRNLLSAKQWRDVPVIMTMDNIPRRGSLRQRLARFALKPIFRRASCWFVPGERSRELLRSWRVPEAQIARGLYAIDTTGLTEAYETRLKASTWPRRLLYVGQYVPRKGLDVLLDAFARYRDKVGVDEAWSLLCCGTGPVSVAAAGVEDRGFVQPADLPAVFAEAGALVLPSSVDHWGQVVTEAAYAGLPVLVSTGCGAEVELVRDRVNGRTIPVGDAGALAVALEWLHGKSDAQLREQGEVSRALAAPYNADNWARQLHELAGELIHQP